MKISYVKNGDGCFSSVRSDDPKFNIISTIDYLRGAIDHPLEFSKSWVTPKMVRERSDIEDDLPMADIMLNLSHGDFVLSNKARLVLEPYLAMIGLFVPVDLDGPGQPYSAWLGGRPSDDLFNLVDSKLGILREQYRLRLKPGNEAPECFLLSHTTGLFISPRIRRLIDEAGLTGVQVDAVEII